MDLSGGSGVAFTGRSQMASIRELKSGHFNAGLDHEWPIQTEPVTRELSLRKMPASMVSLIGPAWLSPAKRRATSKEIVNRFVIITVTAYAEERT